MAGVIAGCPAESQEEASSHSAGWAVTKAKADGRWTSFWEREPRSCPRFLAGRSVWLLDFSTPDIKLELKLEKWGLTQVEPTASMPLRRHTSPRALHLHRRLKRGEKLGESK